MNRTSDIDVTNYIDNGEWELLESRVERRVKRYTCCPEPFPDVIFYLHLRRRTTYYTFNIIVPCVILSILTLGSFFLPPVCGEKVTLGLTVLLAFSVFMLLIAESMPTTSEFVPLIGKQTEDPSNARYRATTLETRHNLLNIFEQNGC